MSRNFLVRVSFLMMVLVSLATLAPRRSEAGVLALGGAVAIATSDNLQEGANPNGAFMVALALGAVGIGVGVFGSDVTTAGRVGLIALPADAEGGVTALQRSLKFLAYSDAEEFVSRVRTKVDRNEAEPVLVQGKPAAYVRFTADEVEEVLGGGEYTRKDVSDAIELLK